MHAAIVSNHPVANSPSNPPPSPTPAPLTPKPGLSYSDAVKGKGKARKAFAKTSNEPGTAVPSSGEASGDSGGHPKSAARDLAKSTTAATSPTSSNLHQPTAVSQTAPPLAAKPSTKPGEGK